MPELAELRLTADYVNKASEGLVFTDIQKNPEHKGIEVSSPSNKFTISALSRGKELRLLLSYDGGETYLRMGMGMSGSFKATLTGKESKHAHLKFVSHPDFGITLSFVDPRRFGKWKVGEDFSEKRSPDPTQEFKKFILNIHDNLEEKIFKKPICEVLMSQGYFNGIGNYLRAEILYRLPHLNPFTPAKEAIKTCPQLLELCRDLPLKAYSLGGGQLKDWENPFKTSKERFEKFILCYNNKQMTNVKDRNGRKFWFDPKWSKSLLYELYHEA